MKCFKKWLLTDEGQILVGDHRAEAAWRAALEEALQHSDSSLVYPDSAIATWIRKELE